MWHCVLHTVQDMLYGHAGSSVLPAPSSPSSRWFGPPESTSPSPHTLSLHALVQSWLSRLLASPPSLSSPPVSRSPSPQRASWQMVVQTPVLLLAPPRSHCSWTPVALSLS